MQQIIYSNSVAETLAALTESLRPASVHVVTDSNVAPLAAPLLPEAQRIVIPPGDASKSLDSAVSVWSALEQGGASRRSVVVNIGGGVVTDLGGFAASTFKRGIRFINLPTSLLGAVDAAVGGKTGINFSGLKNEIGVFAEAEAVVISTRFFDTLPHGELLSGFGEMLKHALLDSEELLGATLRHDLSDHEALLPLLRRSVEIKRRIVAEDPRECGVRRALNLGHTAGHAFEALALERGAGVAHGRAVSWGLVVALVLSKLLRGMDSGVLYAVAGFVKNHYGSPAVTCNDYPRLLELMRHDKKNPRAGAINFTLLDSPGCPVIDNIVDEADLRTGLDMFRDLCE